MGKARKTKKFAAVKRMLSLKDERLYVVERGHAGSVGVCNECTLMFGVTRSGPCFLNRSESTTRRSKKRKPRRRQKLKCATCMKRRIIRIKTRRALADHALLYDFLWLALAMSFCFRCSPQYPSELFFKYNTALGPPYHVLVDTNFINFAIKNKLEIVRAMMDCLLAKCTVTNARRPQNEGAGAGIGSLTCFGALLCWSLNNNRHPMHHRLCHGRAREAWSTLSYCPQVCLLLFVRSLCRC